jgi:hypothetical protein
MVQKLRRKIYKYSLHLSIIVVVFCSCEHTNTNRSLDISKNGDSIVVDKAPNSFNESRKLADRDIIALIEAKKEIPIEMIKNYFYFDSSFLSTRDYISGFSVKRYGDSLILVCIDFYKSPCGERYLVTLHSSSLREIDKLLITTYCDSDQILNDQTTRCKFKSDSTFETEDMLYGKGRLSENGQKANIVYKKNWLIAKNGKITLISSQESEQ